MEIKLYLGHDNQIEEQSYLGQRESYGDKYSQIR